MNLLNIPYISDKKYFNSGQVHGATVPTSKAKLASKATGLKLCHVSDYHT